MRKLFRDVAVYGAGDVAISAVSFLLIPIYTRVLTPTDYGVFALLLTIEAGAKIVLRWGADSAFMRLYYDCPDRDTQRTLASTIWLFLAAVNAPILASALIAAPWLSTAMFGTDGYAAVLRVFFVNTFAIGFFFIPFNVYRIEGRSARFAALTFLRAAGTIVMRLLLVVVWPFGVLGMVGADLLMTLVVGLLLLPSVVDLFRPRWSTARLREALAFGLPRLPHGAAHQATALSDRWILNNYLTTDQVGIYSIGATFGQGMKLFLSAFEYAWAPFYFDAMKRPDAKEVYSRVTTLVFACLALLATGLAAVAADLVRLMTPPAYHDAAAVAPWVALGVVCQGFFQLTAIGLNITKRTLLLPIATLAALSVSVAANIILIPAVGMIGAAGTYALSYGTLALVGFALSRYVYPIRYNWTALAAITAAGVLAYISASALIGEAPSAAMRIAARSLIVALVYCGVLLISGVIRFREIRDLVRERRVLAHTELPAATEGLELGGEIAATPSLVDQASATSASDRAR